MIIYVDGRGGDSSGYGYYVPSTGESDFVQKSGMTNMEAEYVAILSALARYADLQQPLVLYSDAQTVVSQLNHEYSIKKDTLREMARKAWLLINKYPHVDIKWIPRNENPAGKMLG
ncbi:MAG: reverse transcriptase-like protein [Cenarchaeum sp. SB0661_bin_35]|nr:reverse transcriptase-like protein [Cenarchaeum sp. SB0667_bin_13]MYC78983.1 reverse transcriptase-like protein [Cenarchaeum sp. SB0661_bin_35]MYI51535.1 reverse transcriptase-like protein [Cenarchaeum sp. SB0673_bin_9]